MSKPVKIDNNKVIEVVETLIKNGEYEKITARNIANLASISLGSIYNHFKNKNEIIALVLLSSWEKALNETNIDVSLEEGVKNIYMSIYNFCKEYMPLRDHERENNKEYLMYLEKHFLLLDEIRILLKKLFLYNNKTLDDDLSIFLSENLLNFATKLFDYERLENIFKKLAGGKQFYER